MPISIDFKGKLVLITGGGRGIGAGISTALAKAGADLAITYTSQDPSAFIATLAPHGVTIKAFKCNVSSSSEVDAAVTDVEAAFGKKVDIAVANAGISLWKPAHETSDDEFSNMFAVNTFGPFYLSRALARSWFDLPVGLGSGGGEVDVTKANGKKLDKQILFVSSISGLVAMSPQRQAAYNASKGGLTMLAKSLSQEWAHLGIYVNSISPGYVGTDMIENPSTDEERAYAKEWTERTPVGRFASPGEVGEFVAVMLSQQQGGGGFMTGSDVVFDGGYTTL